MHLKSNSDEGGALISYKSFNVIFQWNYELNGALKFILLNTSTVHTMLCSLIRTKAPNSHSTHLKMYISEVERIRLKLILNDNNAFSLHTTGSMQESRKSFARN